MVFFFSFYRLIGGKLNEAIENIDKQLLFQKFSFAKMDSLLHIDICIIGTFLLSLVLGFFLSLFYQ